MPTFSKTTTSEIRTKLCEIKPAAAPLASVLAEAPTDHHSIASSDLNMAIELQASI